MHEKSNLLHTKLPTSSKPQGVGGPTPAVLCGDLNLLRCFVGQGIPTLVVAHSPNEATLRSRYCTNKQLIAPPTQPETQLRDLETIGRRYRQRPVLYYGTDSMLLLISRNREQLKRYFRFRLPDATLVEETVDKNRFSALARRLGLPVPESVASEEADSPEAIAQRIGFPCALKPAAHTEWFRSRAQKRGALPQKALRANSMPELNAAYYELKQHSSAFIAQRWIEGGEDRIYSYHGYLDAQSFPLGHFVGKKIRTYPMRAGVSTFLELVSEPRLLELGAELSQRMNLKGPVKLDFKRDPKNGKFYLLEVNARFTLWNYLGAVSGINLPQLAYADLVGERYQRPTGYQTGTKWLSFGNDMRSFVRDYQPAGQLTLGQWLASLRGPMIYDVFSWRDPWPLGASLMNYSKALWRKLAT